MIFPSHEPYHYCVCSQSLTWFWLKVFHESPIPIDCNGFGYGDSDTWLEVYVCSDDWEAPQISSHLSNLQEWRVYPTLGLSYPYIDKSQRVTLTTGDFLANKHTSTEPIGSLICGVFPTLTLSGIVFTISIYPD